MNPFRIWSLGAGLATVAILGATTLLWVQPQLGAAADADASTAQVVKQNAATSLELGRLSRAAADQANLDATEAGLEKAVPSSLKLNTFSRQLRTTAILDGVTIQSLAPDTGVPYSVSGAGAPAPAASAAAPVAAATATSSAVAGAATGAAPVTKSPWFGKTDPLITGANLTVVPVTVVVTGSESAVLQYASDVQELDRLFTVASVNTTTAEGLTTATLTGSIFSLVR